MSWKQQSPTPYVDRYICIFPSRTKVPHPNRGGSRVSEMIFSASFSLLLFGRGKSQVLNSPTSVPVIWLMWVTHATISTENSQPRTYGKFLIGPSVLRKLSMDGHVAFAVFGCSRVGQQGGFGDLVESQFATSNNRPRSSALLTP
jgi:hypothetical protein